MASCRTREHELHDDARDTMDMVMERERVRDTDCTDGYRCIDQLRRRGADTINSRTGICVLMYDDTDRISRRSSFAIAETTHMLHPPGTWGKPHLGTSETLRNGPGTP
eukprot:1695768-Prymnesium_polylepis.1